MMGTMVAPRAGARIEISFLSNSQHRQLVAPRAGVRIEIVGA